MKKILCILSVILIFLTGCTNKKENNIQVQTGVIGQNIPIKRYQVAKMLALSVYDIKAIDAMKRNISFEDTVMDDAYDKYINAAYTAGLISGADETHFEPNNYLSLEQAQFLLNKLDKTGTLKLQYDHDDRKKPISYSMWLEVFQKTMELNKGNVKAVNIVPLADNKICEELTGNFLMTDKGLYNVECTDINNYMDCTLNILARDKEILGYISVVDTNPYISGTVTDIDGEGALFNISGLKKYYYCNTDNLSVGDNITFNYKNNEIISVKPNVQ